MDNLNRLLTARTFMKVLLIISLTINLIFSTSYLIKSYNSPFERVGVLDKDVKVYFQKAGNDNKSISITIPKGVIVKDASPMGFKRSDEYYPFRFQMVFMSEESDLANYNVNISNLKQPFPPLYLASSIKSIQRYSR